MTTGSDSWPHSLCAIDAHQEWYIAAIETAQAIVDAAHHCCAAEMLAAMATRLPPPPSPWHRCFFAVAVLDRATSGQPWCGPAESALVVIEEAERWPAVECTRFLCAIRQLRNLEAGLPTYRLRALIAERLAGKATPGTLARELGINAREADDAFQKEFGLTIREYVRELRVAAGIELVRAGTKIEAAALMVGYRSKRHFYHAVRVVTGLTPGAHRRRCLDRPRLADRESMKC